MNRSPSPSAVLITVLLLLLSFTCFCDARYLNEPNITVGAFNKNYTIPWTVGAWKLAFWLFFGAALSTGRKKRDLSPPLQTTDLTEALEEYMAAVRAKEGGEVGDGRKDDDEEEDDESLMMPEGGDSRGGSGEWASPLVSEHVGEVAAKAWAGAEEAERKEKGPWRQEEDDDRRRIVVVVSTHR